MLDWPNVSVGRWPLPAPRRALGPNPLVSSRAVHLHGTEILPVRIIAMRRGTNEKISFLLAVI